MSKLLDMFRVSGTGKEEFLEELKRMTGMTKSFSINPAAITALSVCDLKDVEAPDTQAFYMLGNANLDDLMRGGRMKVGRVKKEFLGEETLEELKRTTNLCFMVDKDKYLVSDLSLLTLSARAGVSGEMTFTRQNLIRNMHIADTLQRGGKATIVYREEDGVKKIFAVMGSAYKYIPQTIVADISKLIDLDGKMGKTETLCWEINHSITSLVEVFPEVAADLEATYGIKDKTPGVIIETSDIGCCSITVKSILKSGRGYVEMDEVKFQHTQSTTPEKVMESVEKNVFDKIRKLPECLMTLMGVALTYEETLDMVEQALDSIPRKLLSKDRLKELSTLISAEFDPALPYTLYDVADKFLELPDRVHGLNEVTVTDLRKVCGKLPYTLEKLFSKRSEKEELVLI